jgi:hypothetical protein
VVWELRVKLVFTLMWDFRICEIWNIKRSHIFQKPHAYHEIILIENIPGSKTRKHLQNFVEGLGQGRGSKDSERKCKRQDKCEFSMRICAHTVQDPHGTPLYKQNDTVTSCTLLGRLCWSKVATPITVLSSNLELFPIVGWSWN